MAAGTEWAMWNRILGAIAAALPLLAPAAQAQPEPALLERGRYLVETAAFCGACHGTRGPDGQIIRGMELAGGRVMTERGYRAIVPNITPDPETGIGGWSEAEIVNAIRNGLRPDGSLIGPPMPIEFYRGLSDRDAAAMAAYLRRAPPIRHEVTARSSYPFPLAPYGPPITSVPDPPDNPVARGAYLAGPVAHCMDCHTPELPGDRRDMSRIGAGGVTFEGPWGIVPARNITPHREYGIGDWTDEQIRRALVQGTAPDGRRLAPPMGGRAPVFARMVEGDLRDIIAYLRALPPLAP
jgi:mono/diheme cytochrome c family protein